MARAYQVVSVVFLLLGLFVVYESFQLRYFTRLGPGPGFFGVWLGALLAVFSVIFFVQNTLPGQRATAELEILPPPVGRARLAVTLLTLAIAVVALQPLGFRLTVFGLSMVILMFVGRQSLPVSLAVALAASVGVFYVFNNLLGVSLPVGFLGF